MTPLFSRPLLTIAVAVSVSWSAPALAAATPEEAARLQAIGETYFGKPAAGEAPLVAVVVEDDHYRASFDFTALVRRVLALMPPEEAKKLAFDWPAPSLALAPRGDGTWRAYDYRIPKLVTEADGQRTELVTEGIDIETVTDPATGAMPSSTGRIARIIATSTFRKPGEKLTVTSRSESTDIALQGSARAGARDGGIDAAFHQTVGSMLYGLDLAGGMGDGIPDMHFTLNGGRQDTMVTLRGLRVAALLDLWAHLVAHHAPEDFTTGQGALKARLAAALPLFDAAEEKIAGTDFSFQSPFFVAKAAKAAIDLDLAGLTRDGRFGLAIAVAGFEGWSLFLPKWSQKLMPRDMAVAGRVTGYDLATPIAAFLDTADFSAKDPLSDEQAARIVPLFLPRGTVEVVLDGNRVAAALYEVTLDGRLNAGPAGAKGAITVRARGVDAVADHLAQPGGDEQSKALAGMIAVARGFAERKGDDLVWRFDFDGTAVAVNGKPLK